MSLIGYILFSLLYWLWCALFFQIFQKPFFAISNRKSAAGTAVGLRITAAVYRHGFKSDAIIASYLSAVPLIAGLVRVMFPTFDLGWILCPYNFLIAMALGLIVVSDSILYGFWNSKIDASVFEYLRHPKGAFASVSGWYVAAWLLVAAAVGDCFWLGAGAVVRYGWLPLFDSSPRWWTYVAAPVEFLLMVGLCFLIIRGLGIRPNNPSAVYFHSENFFNHWALNPAYNLIYSLGARDDYAGQFQTMSPEKCLELIAPLFPTEGKSQSRLATDRPDILVVVWESFGAEFCEQLGGRSGVTPNFNRLCDEGLFFTRCCASSFRTDRALPAVFCGLPGQPTATIVRHTRKLPCLPAVARDLRGIGYRTMAVHGGDLVIMHKSDFYLSAGNTRLMAQRDFPGNLDHGKWGVHDLPVLERVADEAARLTAAGERWMISVQTLSSHEPFTVPYDRLADPADNSMAYTDHALGQMVGRLKASGAWDNLLMVVVADHGLNRSNTPSHRDQYSHIPLLFTGGAVRRPERIDAIMSQTDIPATLLGQLGLSHDRYPFSRDVLADTYTVQSSFHTYNNGFLFTDQTGLTDYDNLRQSAAPGTADADRELKGKAILQSLYNYIANLDNERKAP